MASKLIPFHDSQWAIAYANEAARLTRASARCCNAWTISVE